LGGAASRRWRWREIPHQPAVAFTRFGAVARPIVCLRFNVGRICSCLAVFAGAPFAVFTCPCSPLPLLRALRLLDATWMCNPCSPLSFFLRARRLERSTGSFLLFLRLLRCDLFLTSRVEGVANPLAPAVGCTTSAKDRRWLVFREVAEHPGRSLPKSGRTLPFNDLVPRAEATLLPETLPLPRTTRAPDRPFFFYPDGCRATVLSPPSSWLPPR